MYLSHTRSHNHARAHTQATAQAQQQPPGAGQAAAQAQCFWLYLDLFQAAPTQSAALAVAKEFKVRASLSCVDNACLLPLPPFSSHDTPPHPPQRPPPKNQQRADGYRPGTPQEDGQGQEKETPSVALRTVAARLAVSLYNEGGALSCAVFMFVSPLFGRWVDWVKLT